MGIIVEQLAKNLAFGGEQQRYSHDSAVLQCRMNFSVFIPPAVAQGKPLPVLYWLSGLTCTDENFVQKAGAQRMAAQLGVVLVAPDTSPRGETVPDDPDKAYDMGLGAGFYVNATQSPWRQNYQMYDYICEELPMLINDNFSVNPKAQSIFGHSMGGQGALVIALRNPNRYRSVSAFAPIVSAINCPWGQKALSNYLGENKKAWQDYDAVSLLGKAKSTLPMLVDQGGDDQFLQEQLRPELLVKACADANYPLQYQLRPGYDHSYFFIASFIDDHIRFHHHHLTA